MREQQFDICIIGAGWSGLYACKYALENGLKPVVLERREEFGGVWSYSDDPEVVTVMKSTVTSSSATVTEASDFYFGREADNFLHHSDIKKYLQGYAEHFDLLKHIRFNQQVDSVERGEKWHVHAADTVIKSDFLVIATGVHQHKRPFPEELTGFSNSLVHCGDIKSIERRDYGADDSVLVYGGGESASDIIEQLVKTPAQITWAIPNGQHFFRKVPIDQRPAPGKYNPSGMALDEANSRFIQYVSPFAKSKPGLRWMCTKSSTGSALGYLGHGVPQWRNDVPFMHAFLNKNGHVVEFVHEGRVSPEGRVTGCDGDTVVFDGGHRQKFTHIIACCGYKFDFPFLPEAYRSKPFDQHYKLIFDVDDPSLMYLGFARPTIGSIPLLTEIQCQYAFGVISGRLALPDKATMQKTVMRDNVARDRYFYHRRRPKTLVDPFTYVYDLAKQAKTQPNHLKLFFTRPADWYKTFFLPISASHFVLNNPEKSARAIANIWGRKQNNWVKFGFACLLSRLAFVDYYYEIRAKRLYKRQLRELQAGKKVSRPA